MASTWAARLRGTSTPSVRLTTSATHCTVLAVSCLGGPTGRVSVRFFGFLGGGGAPAQEIPRRQVRRQGNDRLSPVRVGCGPPVRLYVTFWLGVHHSGCSELLLRVCVYSDRVDFHLERANLTLTRRFRTADLTIVRPFWGLQASSPSATEAKTAGPGARGTYWSTWPSSLRCLSSPRRRAPTESSTS